MGDERNFYSRNSVSFRFFTKFNFYDKRESKFGYVPSCRHVVIIRQSGACKRKCDHCGKEYSHRNSLPKHRTQKHPEEVKEKQQGSSHSKCQELGCDFAATSINNLRDHLVAVRQMSFSVVEKTFPSMDGKKKTRLPHPNQPGR